jgi:hypothetical protein
MVVFLLFEIGVLLLLLLLLLTERAFSAEELLKLSELFTVASP